jgi:hypothetical protein
MNAESQIDSANDKFEELQQMIRQLEEAKQQQERAFIEQGDTVRKLQTDKEDLYSEAFQRENLVAALRTETFDLKSQVVGVNLLNDQMKILVREKEEAEKSLAISQEECGKLKEACDGLHEELRMVDIYQLPGHRSLAHQSDSMFADKKEGDLADPRASGNSFDEEGIKAIIEEKKRPDGKPWKKTGHGK